MSDGTRTPSMLRFATDPPTLVSLAGLAAALAGIYFAIAGVLAAAMIGLVWAIAFDWYDGRVARAMKNRTAEQGQVGAQVDSLIDVISFGVLPALVLLSAGEFQLAFLPGAFVILAAAVVRLAYFNVFGLAEADTYRGLALDNNAIVLVALVALSPLMAPQAFAVVLYVALMGLVALNVSTLKTPKFGGGWYYAIGAYAVVMTGVLGWQLAFA